VKPRKLVTYHYESKERPCRFLKEINYVPVTKYYVKSCENKTCYLSEVKESLEEKRKWD